MTTQLERAVRFRALHDPAAPLALANAWDAANARLERDAALLVLAAGAAGVDIEDALSDPAAGSPLRPAEEQAERLAADIEAPPNVLAGPGWPAMAELGRLGAARVSLGSAVAEAAYALVDRAAREPRESGTCPALGGALDYGTINALTKVEE